MARTPSKPEAPDEMDRLFDFFPRLDRDGVLEVTMPALAKPAKGASVPIEES